MIVAILQPLETANRRGEMRSVLQLRSWKLVWAFGMTLLYYHPRFLDHDTGHHPEQPERLRQIMARLDATGLAARCVQPTWQPASRARLERVHEPGHIDRLAAIAAHGGGHVDPDTIVSDASFDVADWLPARHATRSIACLAGEAKTALCLVRPPGHHALAERAMGFCLFNNIAIAACVARDEHQLDRVLDRRLGRPPRQRHAGHFLCGRPRGFFIDSPLAVLSGHGCSRRNGHRRRAGRDAQSAGRVRHAAGDCIASDSRASWKSLPPAFGRNSCSSARASTAIGPTRSGRSDWRSKTSPS